MKSIIIFSVITVLTLGITVNTIQHYKKKKQKQEKCVVYKAPEQLQANK